MSFEDYTERARDVLQSSQDILRRYKQNQLDGEHIRELARLTSERDQLNGERIALTEEVSQMRASTSWRMTAPLRSLVHRFRQTMR